MIATQEQISLLKNEIFPHMESIQSASFKEDGRFYTVQHSKHFLVTMKVQCPDSSGFLNPSVLTVKDLDNIRNFIKKYGD